MYYLALFIDNRKYQTIGLRPDNSPDVNRPAPSFVLERTPGQARPLLSIACEAPLVHNGGYQNDRPIDWPATEPEKTPEGVRLHLRAQQTMPPTPQPLPPPTRTDGGFRVQPEGNRCQLVALPGNTDARLSVTLSVEIDGLTYTETLIFHLVEKARIFDVVLDFGSEASQVVISQRDGVDYLDRMKIVDRLVEHYYPNLKGESFHQQTGKEAGQSNDDPELYRSAFFIKKEGAVFLPDCPPGQHGEEELLNLLTDRTKTLELIQDRELVSNLKLAHLGAYKFNIQFADPATNKSGVVQKDFLEILIELQQAVINYFLQTVLKVIHSKTRNEESVYIVVKLLMPNVFSQKKIAQMIAGTAKSLQAVVADTGQKLTGYEISTISESDAAFLGFKREKEKTLREGQPSFFETDGHYLIIDAGKGTTDYSIVQFGEKAELTSRYRSGFIGAGNVLSYAFIDSIFASICGLNAEDRQRAIFDVMQRARVADQLQFTEMIERLKRAYNPNATYKPLAQLIDFSAVKAQVEDPNEPGTLETITNLLKNMVEIQKQESILDEWQIIRQTVNDTAQQIFKSVYYSGLFVRDDPKKPLIRKVILTGRGFLFGPLQTAISNIFSPFWVETVRASDLKKVCLSGSFSTDRINFESNLVGIPDRRSLFGNPGMQVHQIDKGDGVVVTLPILNQLRSLDSVYNRAKPVLDRAKKAWQDMKQAIDDGAQVSAAPERAHPPVVTDALSKEELFLLRGQVVNNFNRRTQTITVSGLDYKKHQIDSPVVNIFYTGETFLIRNAHTCSELETERDFPEDTPWVFRTLFPFLRIQNSAEVQVALLEQDTF